ncbi:MAG: AAA family ATPase [Alphaproteobacteria bacterium]
MDPVRNPFAPGAGTSPPELTGRGDILERARITLGRILIGNPSKSLMIVGLRGVGKTVLLNKIQEMAEKKGYEAFLVEANEGKALPALLLPPLRRILLSLDRRAQVDDLVKRGLRVLRSFANSVHLTVGEIDVGMDMEPEIGVADSGDLDADLHALIIAIGEAARSQKTAIAIMIDELQYLKESEFSALIKSLHYVAQKNLPVTMIGAGLPQLVGLSGRSKSYSERLFDYPEVGALAFEDARAALVEPVRREGADFDENAVEEIFHITQGYPYFLQEWGYHAWNVSEKEHIEASVLKRATESAIRSLDESFFRVRFDRLTPREKAYMHTMARLGPGPHRSGDISEEMGVGVKSVAPVRGSLIAKGMAYSPAHGDIAFTVPLFDQFLRRTMG